MPRRAALITGASKGIGAAIAKRLAKDGFDLALHYNLDAKGAKARAATVRRLGRKAHLFQADFAEPGSLQQVAQAVTDSLPPLSAIIHNAGDYDRRSFQDLDEAGWRRALAVNLEAPALLTRRLLGHLSDEASVVFVSSVAAQRGARHGAAYTAAKAGLLGLTRTLAQELAPKVRVNAVAPGFIDTAMLASDSATKRRARIESVPLAKMGTPGDVANAVSFLAGPDSSYITGAVLPINGGLWMG